MTLKLNGSSSGSVSIDAPASTTGGADVTLTLPVDDGDNGEVLKTNGSGVLSWSSSGGILQVASTTKTDVFSTTSTSFVDITGFSVNITPSSSSNKILVTGLVTYGGSDAQAYSYTFKLMRDSTDICIHDTAGSRTRATFGTQGFGTNDSTNTSAINFLDSPSTTSQITYKVQARAESPKTLYVNRGAESDGDNAISPRFTSTITVMEVAG